MNIRMKRNRLLAAFVLILLLTAVIPVQAADITSDKGPQEEDQICQIIFLLDGSYSMAGERWQEALEGIFMIDAMLPSGYQTALLVYSENEGTSVAFDQSMEDCMAELRDTKQQGYTNPGAALESALGMFDWDRSGGKYVVIISDGEISMRSQEETEAAEALYHSAAAQAADRGVAIDLLLYETEDIEDRITEGAELTGGWSFRRTENKTPGDFAESYLFDRLGLERIVLGLTDSADGLAHISLQDTYAERARVLLTAESRIEDIQVSCQSKGLKVIQGEKFAVILLEQPLEDTVNLQYVLAEKGRMNVFLVKEYSLNVSAEAAYVPETGSQQIQVRVANADGRDVLEDSEVRKAVSIYIDDEKVPYEVSQGKAVITWSVDASQEIVLRVELGGLNSLVSCEGAESSLWLEVPPPELPEEDSLPYLWLWVVVAGVCAAFVILICLFLHSRKKKNASPGMRLQGRPTLMKY